MLSAMIVCNDSTLGTAVENYISMHDSFRLVERTDKGSVAIQAILGLTPDIVICQDLNDLSGLALLKATYPYAPNTFFMMCDVPKNYETLLPGSCRLASEMYFRQVGLRMTSGRHWISFKSTLLPNDRSSRRPMGNSSGGFWIRNSLRTLS